MVPNLESALHFDSTCSCNKPLFVPNNVLVGNCFKGEHFPKEYLVLWGKGHCVLREWCPDARGQEEEPQVVRGHFPEGVAPELGSDSRVGAS